MNQKNQTAQWVERIREEPYRLFFPLGILFGAVGAGHWLFYSTGWIPAYSGLFHSTVQTQGYIGCFVIGFLLTAMPRFAQAPPATTAELVFFLFSTFGIVGAAALGYSVLARLSFIAWLLGLARFAVRRILKVKGRGDGHSPPTEFVWIPVALLHGVFGTLLTLAAEIGWLASGSSAVGKPMAEQGFLLAMVVGVGGFLAPRLMGRFQAIPSREICSVEKTHPIRRRRIFVHLAAGIILFSSFWLEGLGLTGWAFGLRAAVVTGELFWTCSLIFPPRTPELYAKLLWVSLWMVVIGNWAVLFFPALRTAFLHLIFIGGFSLMTFAVATVVTLSHSGEAGKLRQPLPVLWFVAAGLSAALGLRLAAQFFPNVYFHLLGAASLCWLVAGGSWLIFAFPFFLKLPNKEEFEEFHEQAKRRFA